MLSGRLFEMFWLVFIGLVGLLGLTLAMTAGIAFAQHALASGIVATLLTATCAVLCGEAQSCLRAATARR